MYVNHYPQGRALRELRGVIFAAFSEIVARPGNWALRVRPPSADVTLLGIGAFEQKVLTPRPVKINSPEESKSGRFSPRFPESSQIADIIDNYKHI